MINNITMCGNVTRDVEKRGTADKPYITFGLAVTEYKGNGEKSPMFFNCIMFGMRATSVADYIRKGAKICVTGQIAANDYTDKNGVKHAGFSIKVKDLELMSAKPEQKSQDW